MRRRNVKLLKAVAEKLEKMRHKQHFNMNVFAQINECGTVACIAGHALLMSGYKVPKVQGIHMYFLEPKTKTEVPAFYAAKKLLNLTQEQANKLFYTCNWPDEFDPYDTKSAAKRIRYFIRTGK